MNFISENFIDKAVEQIDQSDENYEAAVASLREKQPVLLSYILRKDVDLYTEEERTFLLFICLVCWVVIDKTDSRIPSVDAEKISKIEELNWTSLSEVKAQRFRDRVTVFFDEYPQEDLLAFIEDMLVQDEDDVVSKEGREYIFIAAKNFVDCLIGYVPAKA